MAHITLGAKDARNIVCEDHEDWDLVPNTEQLTNHSRWSVGKTAVFIQKSTNKCYRFDWSVGATESQDEQPYEYEKEVVVTEVSLQSVTREEWLPVKDEQ